jgi:hypothetical protein
VSHPGSVDLVGEMVVSRRSYILRSSPGWVLTIQIVSIKHGPIRTEPLMDHPSDRTLQIFHIDAKLIIGAKLNRGIRESFNGNSLR